MNSCARPSAACTGRPRARTRLRVQWRPCRLLEIESKLLTLEERADWAFNEFWHAHRHSGATCDFGGAAHLLSTNHVASTPNLEQQQRLHRDMQPSSPVMVIFWSFVGVAVGVIVVVVAGVRIMARHKRRQEYSPLMPVNV